VVSVVKIITVRQHVAVKQPVADCEVRNADADEIMNFLRVLCGLCGKDHDGNDHVLQLLGKEVNR